MVHSYYQWVNLVLFFQAVSFYLPRYLWSNFEGKTIYNLQQQLNNPVIEEDKREKQLNRVVKYLTVSKISHRIYGRRYMMVYIIALLNILLNLYITNIFLNYEFLGYAKNVIAFGSMHKDKIFPKLAKCTFFR